MAGFDNDVMYSNNVDFRGVKPVVGQVTADGQLLIGSTASPHIKVSTLTAGTGVTITNGSGTISIAATGGGVTWSTIGASQTLAIGNGYFCTAGATLSLALPAVSALGDMIVISVDGSTGFTVTQGAGQSIRLGNQASTAGVGGSLSSTQQGDTIFMVCSVANLKWNIIDSMGNIIVV